LNTEKERMVEATYREYVPAQDVSWLPLLLSIEDWKLYAPAPFVGTGMITDVVTVPEVTAYVTD